MQQESETKTILKFKNAMLIIFTKYLIRITYSGATFHRSLSAQN